MEKRCYKVIFNYLSPAYRWADVELEVPDGAPQDYNPIEHLTDSGIAELHRQVILNCYEKYLQDVHEETDDQTSIEVRDVTTGVEFERDLIFGTTKSAGSD